MKKGRKLTRRILSIVLTAALVVGLMPGNVMTVRAEESSSTELSVTAFATPEQLMSSDNFALHTDTGSGTAQKVYFGMNGESQQTWYIAGSDADNSIVLLCDPMLPMTTGCFDDKSDLVDTDYKTYDNNWNCTYGTAPSRVYANHYGASDLRLITLPSLESSAFSTSEQDMMLATKVYTDDDMLRDEHNSEYTYYTTDKLYAAYGVYEEAIITVGENSADSLNSGLKVSLTSGPYTNDDITKFYLRTPYLKHVSNVHYVRPLADKVGNVSVNISPPYAVVPAFRLNLASVLFASAAPAATPAASLTDTMTFRVDDTEKIKSKAAYTICGVTVNYDEGDGNVFLYVQDADSVYSVKITEDTIVALSDMTGINNLTDENTKIWLEKSEDNVAYAVMAEALLTEHIPNADDGDCTTAITCSSCGTVTTEAKENHIDDNGDGICDHCDSYAEPKQEDEYYQIANANNLMWFAQKVNEGQTAINAKLTADIDMKDIDWTTMSSFAGTLDGNGHTILYLCADESGGDDDIADGSRCGLFQTLSEGGTVTNLTISGAQLWSANSAGAIAAVNNGTISKCIVKDSTIMLGKSHGLAAIAGTNTGTVTDCGAVNCFLQRRWGAENSSDYAIGAVVEDNSGTVSNCFSYGCRFSQSPNIYAIVESGNVPVNCYYYTDATVSDTVATAKTAEAFASGEVAYLLNGSSSENVTWYQTLGTDAYPVLDSKHGTVYYGYISCSENAQPEYSNQSDAQETKPDHVEGKDVFFTLDGEIVPTCTEGGVGHTECEKCHKVMQTNVTVEASGHTGGTATCKNKAECSVCHEGYGELDKNNHAGETEVKNAKKATCTADGYTGDTYCKDCGAKIATGTKVAALGAPKKGVVAKSDKATYKVTESDLKNGTVAYVGPLDKKATKVTIPATVEIDGVTFKVTSIEKNAFKNNKKVKTVTIGKNVSKIGAKAFYGCSKLKTLKIKTTKLTAKKIGSKAFSKTSKSMKVTVPKKKFKTYKTMLIKKGVNKKAKFKKG